MKLILKQTFWVWHIFSQRYLITSYLYSICFLNSSKIYIYYIYIHKRHKGGPKTAKRTPRPFVHLTKTKAKEQEIERSDFGPPPKGLFNILYLNLNFMVKQYLFQHSIVCLLVLRWKRGRELVHCLYKKLQTSSI